MKRKKLNDVFPTPTGERTMGFFTYLQIWSSHESVEIPFLPPSGDMSIKLDNYYHGLISGEKQISKFLEGIIGDAQYLDANKAMIICGAWWAIHGDNVVKQYNLLTAEYNPIENYHMEEETDNTHSGQTTDAHTGTIIDSNAGSMSSSDSSSSEDKVYAFDSTAYQPSDKTDNQDTLSSSNLSTNTRTLGNTDTRTHGDTIHTETVRHGNIGVTTNQKMVEDERNLWLWNFFTKFLFPTVDAVLTVPYY